METRSRAGWMSVLVVASVVIVVAFIAYLVLTATGALS